MPLQLIQPRDRYILHRGVVDRAAVVAHLRLVLVSFANKGGYTKFYIGITNDVDTRLRDHQRRKPEFQLMVPIYEEDANLVENSFDRLERDTIAAFRAGIVHPDTRQLLLRCANGPDAAPPKTTLYVLIG